MRRAEMHRYPDMTGRPRFNKRHPFFVCARVHGCGSKRPISNDGIGDRLGRFGGRFVVLDVIRVASIGESREIEALMGR